MFTERERRLSFLFGAMDKMLRDRAAYLTEWKSQYKALENELADLRVEFITGQSPLPLEPIPEEVKP